MTEENYEDVLANKGMPVPNVWIELEGEFLDFDKENSLNEVKVNKTDKILTISLN